MLPARARAALLLSASALLAASSLASAGPAGARVRRASPRTLKRAETNLRDVLRSMNLEKENAAAIPGIMKKARGSIGLATALVRLKRITGPVILRQDGTPAGWRGDKRNKVMWSAGERLTVQLLNSLVDDLPTDADRRFAMRMSEKVLRTSHPFSMNAVGGMLRGLPTALGRAGRDPAARRALRTVYRLSHRTKAPPSSEGWLMVGVVSAISQWPGQTIPKAILDIPDQMAAGTVGDIGALGDALQETLAGRDPAGADVGIEAAWTAWSVNLSAQAAETSD